MRPRHIRRAPQTASLYRLYLVLVLAVIVGSPLTAQSSSANSVAWAPVEGADLYRVEITKDGQRVLETFTEETTLPLFIPEGDYEFTVTVFNSFGREVSQTPPSPLAIRTVKNPLIVGVEPRIVAEGGAPALSVRTANLEEGARFSMLYGEEVFPLSAAPLGDGRWSLLFEEDTKFKPGVGHLRVENPSGREDLYMRALRVVESRKLKIKAVAPERLASGGSYADVAVLGEGIISGIRYSFDGPVVVETGNPRPNSEGTSVVLSVDLTEAPAGNYDLIAVGPDGNEVRKRNALQITPPVGTVGVRGLEADKRPPKPLPPFPRGLTFGYVAAIPFGEAADYLEISPFGLSISYLEPITNDLFRRTPVLRNLWWEFGLGVSPHDVVFSLEEVNATVVVTSVGFRYRSDWGSPIQLVVRFGGGLSFTLVDGEGIIYPVDDASSLDYFLQLGLGMEIVLARRWALELGADLTGTFYLTRVSGSLRPYLNGIWRF